MKEKNRLKEISIEIKELLKDKTNAEKVERLRTELSKLLIAKRVAPTNYYPWHYPETESKDPEVQKSLWQIMRQFKSKTKKKK